MQAGRQPRTTTAADQAIVRHLFIAWQAQAEAKHKSGDLAPRTFTDYKYAAELISSQLGKSVPVDQLRPLDFARMRNSLAAESSPGRLTKLVTVTRMVFRWGWESDLLATPVKLGPDFKGASTKQHRAKRNEAAAKFFEAKEIVTIQLDGDWGCWNYWDWFDYGASWKMFGVNFRVQWTANSSSGFWLRRSLKRKCGGLPCSLRK